MRARRVLLTCLLAAATAVALLAQATHVTTSGTLPAHCTVGDQYYLTGSGAGLYNCTATDTWTTALWIVSGVSGSLGGGALGAGACTSGTVSATGATTSNVVTATPTTYPGDGIYWEAYVSSSNTVTVKVCAAVSATPTASTYQIRVVQ